MGSTARDYPKLHDSYGFDQQSQKPSTSSDPPSGRSSSLFNRASDGNGLSFLNAEFGRHLVETSHLPKPKLPTVKKAPKSKSPSRSKGAVKAASNGSAGPRQNPAPRQHSALGFVESSHARASANAPPPLLPSGNRASECNGASPSNPVRTLQPTATAYVTVGGPLVLPKAQTPKNYLRNTGPYRKVYNGPTPFGRPPSLSRPAAQPRSTRRSNVIDFAYAALAVAVACVALVFSSAVAIQGIRESMEDESSSTALALSVPDLEALHMQYEEISLKLRQMELRLEQAKEEEGNAVKELATDQCGRLAQEEPELADYALFYTGGEIHSHSPTMTKGSTVHRVYGIPVYLETRRPEVLIQREPPTLLPGKCWPFEGHSGYVTMKLSEAINVTTVSYEHVKRSMMPEKFVGSAPKLIDIFVGMDQHSMELAGRFRYSYGSDSGLEKFAIKNPKQARYVQFAVMDNYGGDYTCLYRIRVQGFPASADSAHSGNLIL